ncbi:MAG: hypothetical protein WBK51_18240 [Polaromonas sp.]
MSDHEEGLVNQYEHEIRALCVRAELGEDIPAVVETVIARAVEHFRIVRSGDPQANLTAFRGRLQIIADATHSSQQAFKRTLQHAINICPTEI